MSEETFLSISFLTNYFRTGLVLPFRENNSPPLAPPQKGEIFLLPTKDLCPPLRGGLRGRNYTLSPFSNFLTPANMIIDTSSILFSTSQRLNLKVVKPTFSNSMSRFLLFRATSSISGVQPPTEQIVSEFY